MASPNVFSPEYLDVCQQLLRIALWMSYVRDVQETILILVLLIYRAHKSGSRRQDLVDEDEDGFLRRQLNPLANHVDELADGQVSRDQVLLLVDGRDVRLLDLLADYLRIVSCCAWQSR